MAPPLFSTSAPPWRPRWAKGTAPSRSSSASLDLDDCIDLDRGSQRQHRHADGAAGMAPGLAEHVLHQLGRAIGDLGLMGEAPGAVDEHAQLDDPLAPLEPHRLLDLREQHEAAGARGADPEVEIALLAETAGEQGAVL